MDIININVGQCGRGIGDALMHIIYADHFSQQQPVGRHQTFFREAKTEYYARSLFFDMDVNNGSDVLKNTKFYKQNNILTNKTSTNSIFGIPRYQCIDFKHEMQESIRKEYELSDGVSGVVLESSFAGGAGSGLTRNAQQIIRDAYPDKILQTFKLMPQLQTYVHPIEIYNTAFSIHNQVEYSDMSLMFDNGMFHKFLLQDSKFNPTVAELNRKIAQSIADTTLSFRFKGQINTSQRKIASNLVMFPRMHFLAFSKTPKSFNNPLVSALSLQNFTLTNYLQNSSNRNQATIFSVYAGVRSNVLTQNDISPTVKKQLTSKNLQFADWIGDNVHISLHEAINGRQNASVFINSRHYYTYLRKISDLMTASFRRKAFIHHYTSVGMDQMQFTEAQSNMNDLWSQYQPHWSCEDDEWLDQQDLEQS